MLVADLVDAHARGGAPRVTMRVTGFRRGGRAWPPFTYLAHAYARRLTRRRTRGLVQVLLRRRLEARQATAAAEEVFSALVGVPMRRVGANAHAAHWVDRSAISGFFAGRVMGMLGH
jgi:hypothetical protein